MVTCMKCNKTVPPGVPFYDVDHAPKCKDCCLADGAKPSPKISSRPVACRKCNKEIPAGTPFYDIDRAPKCKDCCNADFKPTAVTAPKSVRKQVSIQGCIYCGNSKMFL
ncbi:hypothetical protein OSTOST_20505 [Ostertagia ostertagi]